MAIKASRLGNSDSSRSSRYLSNTKGSDSLDLEVSDKLGFRSLIGIFRVGVGLSLFSEIARFIGRYRSNKELKIF